MAIELHPVDTPKMNPEVKALWLKALRSGEYKQTDGQLKHHDLYFDEDSEGDVTEACSFCCLGVLSDLHSKVTGEGKWAGGTYIGNSGESETDVLIKDVMEWAGLDSRNPVVTAKPVFGVSFMNLVDVAELNDNGHSFAEIADVIEAAL